MGTYEDLYKRQTEAGKTLDLDPTFLKLDKAGDYLIGRLMRSDEVKARAGTGSFKVYVFDTDDGLIKTKLGGATDKQAAAAMKIGSIYRIEFLGKEKLPEGNEVNRWKIEEIPDAATK
jgi:hypothetical protein